MPLNRIVLYVKDVEKTVAIYEKYFGFTASREEGDRIVEPVGDQGGASFMIHPAGKGQKSRQSLTKLVFDMEDVAGFCASCKKNGLIFGVLHQADGYAFANARDPQGNAISVSSRGYRKQRMMR